MAWYGLFRRFGRTSGKEPRRSIGFICLPTLHQPDFASPLLYPGSERPFIYYLQIGIMLVYLIVLFLVDYVLRYDFRQTQWMVISYVMLYFAGAGGMIGVASLAGRSWTVSAIILFLITFILAYVQRAVTGI